uniref:Uncharacterized protein n=1 Tax=Ixodes ricinus TaxID=34613 RepID=A0A6B0UK49_IXORI
MEIDRGGFLVPVLAVSQLCIHTLSAEEPLASFCGFFPLLICAVEQAARPDLGCGFNFYSHPVIMRDLCAFLYFPFVSKGRETVSFLRMAPDVPDWIGSSGTSFALSVAEQRL